MASNASTASEGSITLLELRSPLFGEICISNFMFESEVVFFILRRFSVEVSSKVECATTRFLS